MELLKKRNFGLAINDTFLFFKIYGRDFIKQYLTIIGGFLLILTVLFYFTFKYYFESLFTNIGVENGTDFDSYLNNNPILFLSIAVFLVLLISVLTLIAITIPILFLKNIAEKKIELNVTSQIWKQLMQNKLKMFLYFLSLIVLSIPIVFLFLIISKTPTFFILWMPVYFIVFPIYFSVIFQAYLFYLIENKTLWESFVHGFENIKSNFWMSIGNVIIMTIVVQVIQVILTMIPYLIFAFNLFVHPSPNSINDPVETISMVTIMISAVFVLYILSSYILNNLIIINQGIIFYSCKEKNENISALNLIDSIGKNEL